MAGRRMRRALRRFAGQALAPLGQSARIDKIMDSLSLIREFLQSRLGVASEKVAPDVTLDELGVDSLMVLELMFEFEERFGLTLAILGPP